MSPGDAGSTPPLGVTPPAVILHPAGSAGGVQSFWQLSLLTSLPSSHSSLPFLMPSPQKVQLSVPHVFPVRQAPSARQRAAPCCYNGLAQKAGVPDAFEVHGSRTGSRIGAR